MKSLLKALGLLALMSGSSLQGYALVFDKDSPIPYVDVYMYNVKSADEAIKKHANLGRLLGLPQNVIDILEKGRGVSATVATALGPATDGASIFVQKGVYQVVDAGKIGLKMFNTQITDLLGRAFRGENHAFHKDVWRGNAGRDAEWSTDKTMYAIVTLPNNLVALNDPVLIPPHTVDGFTITMTPDPQKPGNTLYKAKFDKNIANVQYSPAAGDKRDKKKAKELAKTSGEAAYNQDGGAATQPANGGFISKILKK